MYAQVLIPLLAQYWRGFCQQMGYKQPVCSVRYWHHTFRLAQAVSWLVSWLVA